jgi:putative DNA primase/helicase
MVSPEQLARAKAVNIVGLLDRNKVLRKTGSNYMALCDFHSEDDPSMSLFKGTDGNWRFKCHGCQASGDTVKYITLKRGMPFADAVAYLAQEAKTAPEKPKIVATYDYCDEHGELLYQTVRYSPKDFRQRRPTPQGWVWNLKDVRRVLYRLPELLDIIKAPGVPIYYVEGEKDVESMRALGFTATTHAGGAQAYRKELLEVLPPRQRIVVIPDMDEPGKQLMRRVFADGRAMGHDVGFLLLPEVDGKQHKDISEWLEAGLDIAEALKHVK